MSKIETQSKETLPYWAVEYSVVMLPLWRKHYPIDLRPSNALTAVRDWLAGTIKLPQAKKAILECHARLEKQKTIPLRRPQRERLPKARQLFTLQNTAQDSHFTGALAVAYDALGTEAQWERLKLCAAKECGRMLDSLRSISVEDEPLPCEHRLEELIVSESLQPN